MSISSNLWLGLALAAVIGYLAWERLADRRVVFVDTISLVESYQMKKELSASLERDFQVKKGVFDSLKTYFVLDTTNAAVRRQLFDLEQQLAQLQEDYQGISTTVWNRINPLLAEFGKEKGYDIIVGANGMGTVLYGKPAIDITQEVLDYINKEYEAK